MLALLHRTAHFTFIFIPGRFREKGNYQDKGKKHKDCEPMMEKAKELLGKLGELAV